ncbi:conserved hypothetical protein [Ricinus communis]|uniref:Uncharacterized protein n=1 Tax=Ricinus communis TaxID=3988 RepID=B9SU60_RICCO|nr:conserved hypothetical protein [Ricinus communis]
MRVYMGRRVGQACDCDPDFVVAVVGIRKSTTKREREREREGGTRVVQAAAVRGWNAGLDVFKRDQ